MIQKTNYILVTLICMTLLSCDKTDGLKRKLNGKYKIETYHKQCDNELFFEISNPGKINFTGKKTIQGSTEFSHTTYVGYFDYEYDTKDINGNIIKQTEKEIFKYAFPKISNGDFDTVLVEISFRQKDYNLFLERDGKGKIKAFKYYSNNNCFYEHIVE